jgi:heme/copper-type cytochrome/quinol oxidase subunit 3
MAELHPIVLHFHIALLAFSLITTFITFSLAILEKIDFFNRKFVVRLFRGKLKAPQKTVTIYVDKFEFVAFACLVYGLISIVIAIAAGVLDASGSIGIENISIDNFFKGIEAVTKSEILSYKAIWTIFGTYFFILAAVIRIYFVNVRHERLCGQNILIQILHLGSQFVGYLILTMVAGAGAILVYGGTLISDLPILNSFLPGQGGDLLPIVLIAALVSLILIIIAGFSKKPPVMTPPVEIPAEHEEEHEITLWPAILAFGTALVAIAVLLFAQGEELSAIAFFWAFFVLLISFIFNEAYTQKLFKKPKEGWVWLFLGSEVILFSMIIGTSFGLRIASGANWPVPSETLNIPLTAVNTFILIVSSFTMVKAVETIQNDNPKGLRNFLLATCILGSIFLSIQVIEYLSLLHEGFTPTTNLFGSTFYIQTGLHGAHVFFGVLIVLFTTLRAHQGGFTKENHAGVELVGLYWHFVDLVWIILFTLVYLI